MSTDRSPRRVRPHWSIVVFCLFSVLRMLGYNSGMATPWAWIFANLSLQAGAVASAVAWLEGHKVRATIFGVIALSYALVFPEPPRPTPDEKLRIDWFLIGAASMLVVVSVAEAFRKKPVAESSPQ